MKKIMVNHGRYKGRIFNVIFEEIFIENAFHSAGIYYFGVTDDKEIALQIADIPVLIHYDDCEIIEDGEQNYVNKAPNYYINN